MATVAGAEAGATDEGASPPLQIDGSLDPAAVESFESMKRSIEPLDNPADQDAQTTVTDFLDFTEYLPADVMRSMTLIGKLDKTYAEASTKVHELTKAWADLPNVAPEKRLGAAQLRADISENLNRTVSSRKNALAEANRNFENIDRHCKRLQMMVPLLVKMVENFPPPEEQKSPVVTKSPQLLRTPKVSLRVDSAQRKHRPRVPRITVPGEVLAPWEIDYDQYSDSSEATSEEEDDESLPGRASAAPRIKLIKNTRVPKSRTLKVYKSQNARGGPPTGRLRSTSPKPPRSQKHLRPPPAGALPGSSHAPWLQLTGYELAVLRKRMKKNSSWSPSDTMIARELKQKGRGFEAWKAAKAEAEQAGRPFEDNPPDPVPGEDGDALPVAGALSLDAAAAAADKQKGKKKGTPLNEAKNTNEESSLAQLAAKEAEESTRRMQEAARAIFQEYGTPDPGPSNKVVVKTQAPRKRKRDATTETTEPEKAEPGPSSIKRTKTETPVPIPQPISTSSTQGVQDSQPQSSQVTSGAPVTKPQSATPVPVPNQDQSGGSSKAPSPLATGGTMTTTVPVKLPAPETPILPPVHPKTPIQPPARETRTREAARKEQQKEKEKEKESEAATVGKTASRAATPAARPPSRGKKAESQEPQQSLAADRPRRASTARNTPAPDMQQSTRQSGGGGGAAKRQKRPAPGVVSRTNSGGNTAVGRRKAAPKKGRGKKHKDKGEEQVEIEVEVEVDDEGNVIDPDEARYCLCNRVSFGEMIQCENIDNCKMDWFHLECVGLSTVPARTTKWYCPECRVLLNIGEKGEVSARGIKK